VILGQAFRFPAKSRVEGSMKKTLIAVACFPVLIAFSGLGANGISGCKKKEEEVPPPPPPVAVAPAPAPAPVAIVTEEDAGATEDVVPDVKKVTVHAAPADVAGLRACCVALQQNAASMPQPNNTYALQAAQVCQSLVTTLAAGATTKNGALGTINSLLKGANLPPACR
jgi:hypothetical protein